MGVAMWSKSIFGVAKCDTLPTSGTNGDYIEKGYASICQIFAVCHSCLLFCHAEVDKYDDVDSLNDTLGAAYRHNASRFTVKPRLSRLMGTERKLNIREVAAPL